MAGGSSVTFRLFGQDVSASAALGKVSGAARSAASSIGSINASIGTIAVGNVISNLASQVANFGKTIVESGIETAANVETSTMAIENMTGSIATAHKIMSGVLEEAKSSPFDTTAILDWSKKLLGAGMAADHVLTSVHTISDAMAGYGLSTDKASDFMLAWTQMMARGKIDLGNLNQMSNTGVNILALFSKATGKSTAELTDMISKGQLLSKDVLPAVEKYMQAHYMGDQAKMAHTLTGAWGNLKDAINIGIGQAIVPAQGAIENGLLKATKLAGDATQWLADTGVPALMRYGRAVKDYLDQPLRDVAGYIQSDVIPRLEEFAGWLQDNSDKIKQVALSVAAAFAAFKGISMVSSAMGAIAAFANPIGLVTLAVIGLAGGLTYLYQNNEGFRTFIDDLATRVVPAFNAVLGYFSNLWTTYIQPALADAAQYLLPKLQNVWDSLIAAVGPGSQTWLFVQQVFAVLGPILKDIVIPALSWLAGVVLDKLSASFQAIGWLLNSIIIPTIRNLGTGFMTVVGWIIDGAQKAFGWIPGLGPKLDQAAGWFDNFKNDVNTSLSGLQDQSITVSVTPITSPNSVTFGQPTSGQNMVGDLFGKNGILSGGSGNGTTQKAQQVAGGHSTSTPKGAVSQAWGFLKQQGFTDAAAAGVIGNLMGESGLNPTALGDHGTSYGIAQWHNGRWANLNSYARKKGQNASSLNTQLGFLMQELGQGAAGNLGALKSSNSIDAVVSQMVRLFERPANPGAAIGVRTPNARRVYAQMHGKGGSSSSGGNGYEGLSDAGPSGEAAAAAKAAAKAAATARKAVGKEILRGGTLWKNLHGTSQKVIDELNKLRKNAGDAGGKAGRAVVAAYQGTLVKLARTHDSITKRLKDANANLKKLISDRAKYISEQGHAAIDSAAVGTTDDLHFGAIVHHMQEQLNWYNAFARKIADLKKKGLFANVLDQLVQMGPEKGMQAATEILAQGKAGITEINNLQNQLGRAGRAVGTPAADALYNAGISAAQGLVKGLQSQEKNLNALMTRLAGSMAKSLKRALGIRSPSRVFAGIGEFTGHGLIQGLQSTAPAVSEAAANLIATASTPMDAARRIPTQAGRGGVTNVWHIQTIDPDTAARKVGGLLERAEARGTG